MSRPVHLDLEKIRERVESDNWGVYKDEVLWLIHEVDTLKIKIEKRAWPGCRLSEGINCDCSLCRAEKENKLLRNGIQKLCTLLKKLGY